MSTLVPSLKRKLRALLGRTQDSQSSPGCCAIRGAVLAGIFSGEDDLVEGLRVSISCTRVSGSLFLPKAARCMP